MYLVLIKTLYTPQEWYQHVKDSAVTGSSGVEVIEMQQEYFLVNTRSVITSCT